MPYEILLQHISIVPCLCVFGISHFGLYYLYSSTNENKELQKQLSILLKIFPYKSFICIDKYLVIFDEKYLREDIQKAPFKYGGEVNLVGYATNATHVNKISSFFSGPSDMINSILKSLFETSDDLFIVHPIALYYE